MINSNKVLGIIFANMHDKIVSELTEHRTMSSIPFGGRYRLIDFTLSNMVNSGITTIGLITKSNYQSLMDHLGNGSEWDLDRKNGGLRILPPYGNKNLGVYRGRIEALNIALDFIKKSTQDYVIMSDCDIVANIDFTNIIQKHIDSNADITVGYQKRNVLANEINNSTVVTVDKNNFVTDVLINPQYSGEFNVCLNLYVVSKKFLEEIIVEYMSKGRFSFEFDLLQQNLKKYKIIGFEYEQQLTIINSIKNYYKSNMKLLDSEYRKNIFNNGASIYTKIKDEVPVKYGINAKVKNSLIADGCLIEGEIENSIIFRSVKINEGVKIKNSIIMQSCEIEKNCEIKNAIIDKNVTVKSFQNLCGTEDYPVFVSKNAVV